MGVLWLKVLAAVAAAVMLALAFNAWTERLREQGRGEVRAQWVAADKQRQADVQAAALVRERAERAKELRMQQEKEDANVQAQKREVVLRGRVAELQRSTDGLRQQLAAHDADSRDRRAAGTCAVADAEADEAARARGLFRRCTARYAAMAERAADLADQVMGLQDHVLMLQPGAGALMTTGERP